MGTPSNLEELDSESKISSVISSWWVSKNSITKNLRRLRRSKDWRMLEQNTRIRFNVVFAGVQRRTPPTHWLLHANVKELLAWFISNALKIGFWHRNKKNHQMLRTKMSVLSTGSVSNARSVSRCTHTLSKSAGPYTRSLIYLSKWTTTTTIFCLSRCHLIRIPPETSICWLWHLSNLNSSLEEAMRARCESMISVWVDVTPSLSASRMDSTLKITPLNLEPLFCSRTSSDWRPNIRWQSKLAAQW